MGRYRDLEKEFIKYCLHDKLEKVKACLTLGVDVNFVLLGPGPRRLESGLAIAAKQNNLELLEILLSHPDIKV